MVATDEPQGLGVNIAFVPITLHVMGNVMSPAHNA